MSHSSNLNGNTRRKEIVTCMETNLYKAAAEGNTEPFKNRDEPLDHLVTPRKNTILHIYLTSPSKRSPEFVEEVLGKCPELLLKVNEEGETPLHIAARYGHSEVAKLLIKQAGKADLESGGRNVVVRQLLRMANKKKETALHEAARSNSFKIVNAILDKEDPEFTYSANDSGESPLFLAVYHNSHINVVKKILDTCKSVACGGPNGKTALHAAVLRCYYGAIDELMDKKSSLANEVDEDGWTPLHYDAYFHDSPKIAKKLLAKDKSATYIADKDRQRTALHMAACRDHASIMKEIISRCPDCCELTDTKGWNVLHYAVICKNDKVIKIILEDPSLLYLMNAKDAKGYTPLYMHYVSRFPLFPSFILQGKTQAYEFFKQKVLSFFDYDELPPKKKEVIKWMKDLGSGPLGEMTMKDDDLPEVEKATEAHLIVAVLIATVTFAAAFTLPGGLKGDKEDTNRGTPILSKSSAFQAFVVTDTFAFVFSICSVFMHFMQPLLRRYEWLAFMAFQFILVAMAAMAIAFITGIYAVLVPSSLGLAVVTCLIGLAFFVLTAQVILVSHEVSFSFDTFFKNIITSIQRYISY